MLLSARRLTIPLRAHQQEQLLQKFPAETEAEIKFGYCTEFIIVLNAPISDNEEHAYKAFLESIGDSIVVVADDEIVKTHVHTNDPGLALQKALTLGSLSKIKIDNMREEHQEKLIKDSQKLAAQQKAEEEAYEAACADERQITCLQRKWDLYLFQSERE